MPGMDAETKRFYQANAAFCAQRWESIASDAGVARYFDVAFPEGSTVLDVGCGSGRDLAALVAAGHDAFGVEPVTALRVSAAELHPELVKRIVAGALPTDIDLPDEWPETFDGVVCSAVLMHVPPSSLCDAFATIAGRLRPTGRLLLSIPATRPQIVDDRDGGGRLFTGVTSDELCSAGSAVGLREIERWTSLPDAQFRTGNSWDILLLGRDG